MNFLKRIFEALIGPVSLGIVFTLFSAYTAFDYYNAPDWYIKQDPVLSQLKKFHQDSIDIRLRQRGPRAGSPRVAILTVDEKALLQEGRWPFPRGTIKKIIEKLVDGGASVIGFDMIFAEEERNSAVVSLERLGEKYQGGETFRQLLTEEINSVRTDQQLGKYVSEAGAHLVLGAYFDPPGFTKMDRGYKNLCLNTLFQRTKAFETWDNYDSVLIPIDQTAMDVPDEIPSPFHDALMEHFEKVAEKTEKEFIEDRVKKGYSAEISKNARIDLEQEKEAEMWKYCGRWLHDPNNPQFKEPEQKDENYETYRALWDQVGEEDETLTALSFDDGIELFKNRQLNSHILLTGHWWLNADSIGNGATHVAYFNAFLDEDGTIRKSNLVVRAGNYLFPSLALRSFLVANNYLAQLTIDRDPKDPDSKALTSISITDSEGEPVSEIPVSEAGELTINYAGPDKMFPHLSVADVLSDAANVTVSVRRYNEKEKEWVYEDEVYKKEEFYKDKIFIFGATATGIFDLRVTPFAENYPGVETHANLVDNILRSDYLKKHPIEESYMVIGLFVIGIVLSILVGRLGALAGLSIVVVLLSSFYFADRYLIFGQNIVIHIIFPIFLVVGIYGMLTIYKYFTEERNKKQLKGTFGKYVSPAIVEEILSDPSKIQLGGKKEHMTVFFSDIRGFTTISEALDAEALSDLLNSYLTPMTEIIFENKGTLDKYMGDAIMAFFGAPITFDDHAKYACRAALKNLEQLKELQEEYKKAGLPMLDVGIGLNTGEMSVGNMGSETVRSYTVMGDAVNLGARLEGINKQYGTRIIISEFTERELGDEFVRREIDWVKVKGKTEPVRIFELIDEGEIPEKMAETVHLFKEGFNLYHDMKWQEALDKFNAALNITPDDECSKLYLQRTQDYIDSPPPSDWDGVYTMTTNRPNRRANLE